MVTGASDDDPSGIGTYSQVGAQFGYGLLWTMVLSYRLMAAIQEISARIGRVTGVGIAVQSLQELSQASSLRRAVYSFGGQRLQPWSRYRRDGSGDAVGGAG